MNIRIVAENIWAMDDIVDIDTVTSIEDEIAHGSIKIDKHEKFEYLPANAPRWAYLCKGGNHTVGDNIFLINLAERYKYLAQRILQRNIVLDRVNTNIQKSHQDATFHMDGGPDSWTLLLFVAKNWDSDWGGEFICKSNNTYVSVPYIPGNGALFRGDYDHRGCAPNGLTGQNRVSIAFTYTELP